MFKENLTDPKEHNPKNFVYIVSGLLDLSGNYPNLTKVRDKVKRIKDPEQFYRASIIGCLNAETAKQKLKWPNGDISHTATFGNVGVIISPRTNGLVYIAWDSDLGSPWDPKKLKNYAKMYRGRIRNHTTLLTRPRGCDGHKYNELVIKGDQETDIQGIFCKPITKHEKTKARTLKKIVENIMQKEVPVIELPKPVLKDYSDIDPEQIELAKRCEFSRAQSELMISQREFYNPPNEKTPTN